MEIFLYFVAAGVGLLILSEILLRIYIRKFARSYWRAPGTRLIYTLHPKSATLLKDREIRWQFNRLGERSGNPPAGNRLYRVLVVGGSAAECTFLDQDKTWAAQLQTVLSRPENLKILGCDAVHVGLLAASATDSRALKFILERYLPYFPRIDTVIIMNGISDALRWLEAGAPSGEAAPPKEEKNIFTIYPSMPFTLRRPAIVYYAVTRLLAMIQEPKHDNVGRLLFQEAEARQQCQNFATLESDPGVMLSTFDKSLREVLALLRQYTKRIIVAHQPYYENSNAPKEEEVHFWSGRVGAPKSVPSWFLAHKQVMELCAEIFRHSEKIAEEEKLEEIDVRPVVRGPLGEFYYDQFHFNPNGAKVVAGAIADVVLRSPSR